jgi:hypothetical protein
MRALERRGHEVVWPDASGKLNLAQLTGCDIVHVYRRFTPDTQRTLSQLRRSGIPFTYDNDDDFTVIPRESPSYKTVGGLNSERAFAMTVKIARLARRFTTTSEPLAEKYRRAGVEHAEVIGNFVSPDIARPRNRHQHIVIGWVAAHEHMADVGRLGLTATFERLIAKHANVEVESIGVDLHLRERYRHHLRVSFEELPRYIGRFDIGIAPLADIAMNWTRSDIKLKEYAASGAAWLASPVGPYAQLGEQEGGRLVSDDGWFEALDHLVTHGRRRRALARKARRWAKAQTMDAVAARWEQVFVEATAHEAPA